MTNTLPFSDKYMREVYINTLRSWGFRLIPVIKGGKLPDTRLMATKGWRVYIKKAPTPFEYQRWVYDSDCNFAAVLGTPSNAFVLDFDHLSPVVARQFLSELPTTVLNKLRITITSKGYHVYVFVNPNVQENDVPLIAKLGNKKLSRTATGKVSIETRGTGGYAIVPPSVHPSGAVYTWGNYDKEHNVVIPMSFRQFTEINVGKPVSDLWLQGDEVEQLFDVALATDSYEYKSDTRRRKTRNPVTDAYTPHPAATTSVQIYDPVPVHIEETLAERISDTAHATVGERNDMLFRTSVYMGRVLHMLDSTKKEEFIDQLLDSTRANGMAEETLALTEIEQTVKSGIRRGVCDPLEFVYVGATNPFNFL